MCIRPYRIGVQPLLVALAACASLASQAVADLEGRHIGSIEWLVDNSDVVAIVKYPQEGNQGLPTVVRALKGDEKRLDRPLEYPPYSRSFPSFSSNGSASLIFVQGSSKLLAEIAIARPTPEGYSPKIEDIYYGVTQYEEVLLTQSAFLRAVASRIQSGPGQVLPSKHKYHEDQHNFVLRPKQGFPIGAAEVDYTIIVSLSVELRDHYIEVLKTGDASDRIHAIDVLVAFDDEAAVQAIRDATQCRDVSASYGNDYGSGSLDILTTEDVKARARHALDSGY